VNGLTREELRHLGRLAQLELSEADLEHLEGELSRIVGYVEQLAAVDVEGVEPLIQPIELPTAIRPDKAAPSDAASSIVSLAPRLKDGMYVVPPVIENP
jgi:aspartyl-tRNA(Asn)/glutamyl-tRNA(Gln) amidotransferase subunit C